MAARKKKTTSRKQAKKTTKKKATGKSTGRKATPKRTRKKTGQTATPEKAGPVQTQASSDSFPGTGEQPVTGAPPRFRREEPRRTQPWRDGRQVEHEESWREGPDDEWPRYRPNPIEEGVERAADLGYRVIEEQIERGRRLADELGMGWGAGPPAPPRPALWRSGPPRSSLAGR